MLVLSTNKRWGSFTADKQLNGLDYILIIRHGATFFHFIAFINTPDINCSYSAGYFRETSIFHMLQLVSFNTKYLHTFR